jgi:Putative peptidoglycan binding domain
MEMKSPIKHSSAKAASVLCCRLALAGGAFVFGSPSVEAFPEAVAGAGVSSAAVPRAIAVNASESVVQTRGASRWRGSHYYARPSSSIGVSIYSGPGPYYPRQREHYPYYSGYGGPVYVSPPPVIYRQPPVIYSAPPVYYGAPVPSARYEQRYEVAPPPRPSPAIDPRVLQVQENLRRLGYYKGPVDGLSGSGTRSAIRSYQVDRGLPVTGRIDKDLLQDLGL